jgi:hypothetical protein
VTIATSAAHHATAAARENLVGRTNKETEMAIQTTPLTNSHAPGDEQEVVEEEPHAPEQTKATPRTAQQIEVTEHINGWTLARSLNLLAQAATTKLRM